MTTKQFFAGLAADILHRLQNATRGKIGGFGLYHNLWTIYTQDYQISRTGHLAYDLRH